VTEQLDLVGLVQCLADSELSAAEALEGSLALLDEINPTMRAFVYVADRGQLREQAADIDRRRAAGEALGPLAGVPIAVKDTENVEGMPTTCGSWLCGQTLEKRDSVHVARLRRAGAITIGKTNTPEFAYSIHTRNRRFGETLNPVDPARSVGGSSGGSAAAVAAGIVPLATGSDGGGSIRIPAAFCRLPGLKPTFGRIPLETDSWGQLTHVGAVTRSFRDLAFYLDVVAGPAPTDRFSLPAPETSLQRALRRPVQLSDLRVVATASLFGATADAEIAGVFERALEQLRSFGVSVARPPEDPLPDARRAFIDLASYVDGAHWATLEDGERARATRGYAAWCERGRQVSVDDLVAAEHVRTQVLAAIESLLSEGDAIVTPTFGTLPWRLDHPPDADPVDRLFTFPFNLTGHPAMSVPLPGVSAGLQFAGPRFAEGSLLRVGAAISAAVDTVGASAR
jgi:Asp-tRNA(Asn)/Glu-tRNA(Gln) amidotransferase A subunit family amidase